MNYRGWYVWGSGNLWRASRHGVRMNTNSEAGIKRMIDLRLADEQRERDERAKANGA